MRLIIPIQTWSYNLEPLKPVIAEDFSVTIKSLVCLAKKLTSDGFFGCAVALVKWIWKPQMRKMAEVRFCFKPILILLQDTNQ